MIFNIRVKISDKEVMSLMKNNLVIGLVLLTLIILPSKNVSSLEQDTMIKFDVKSIEVFKSIPNSLYEL
ncbi:hypothetical protein [Clostridium argentinense]|nr:hypothetical protein [Clostridium argentinense]NFF39642.1 hypothetical protein [Clostridium argentinense]